MPWYWIAVIGFCGFFLGALVMALAAMARCSDCETIERIRRGGKP
jgi:H+/Cl- antiporter ClcA